MTAVIGYVVARPCDWAGVPYLTWGTSVMADRDAGERALAAATPGGVNPWGWALYQVTTISEDGEQQ